MIELLVNIDVDDLDRAIDFYTHAFDLRKGRRLGRDAVELLGASVPIYLLAKAEGTEPCAMTGPIRDYGRHWTPVHVDIIVPDIDAAVARAIAAGAILERAASTHDWGRLAVLSDPFGNGFCLVQFLGHGYDEVASA